MFAAVRLATVLFASGPGYDHTRNHLFVLLTDEHGPAKQVLLVPICTAGSKSDKSCLIAVGDHPFIKDESFIDYGSARVEPGEKLTKGVASGEFTDKGLIDEAVFKRIITGLRASPRSRPFSIDFYDGYARAQNAAKKTP